MTVNQPPHVKKKRKKEVSSSLWTVHKKGWLNEIWQERWSERRREMTPGNYFVAENKLLWQCEPQPAEISTSNVNVTGFSFLKQHFHRIKNKATLWRYSNKRLCQIGYFLEGGAISAMFCLTGVMTQCFACSCFVHHQNVHMLGTKTVNLPILPHLHQWATTVSQCNSVFCIKGPIFYPISDLYLSSSGAASCG